jgi:hypothetical protein
MLTGCYEPTMTNKKSSKKAQQSDTKRHMGFRLRADLAEYVGHDGHATGIVEESIALRRAVENALTPLARELESYVEAHGLQSLEDDAITQVVVVQLLQSGLKSIRR